MKFGIHLPATYELAVLMDKESGNTFWRDATKKEMKNVEVAFKFLDDGINMPIGFKKITCHLIFDVKFDLTRKAMIRTESRNTTLEQDSDGDT